MVHGVRVVARVDCSRLDCVLRKEALLVDWKQKVASVAALVLVGGVEVEIYVVALGSIWRNLLAVVVKIGRNLGVGSAHVALWRHV